MMLTKHGYGYSTLVKHKIDTSLNSWIPYGGDILMYIYVCVYVSAFVNFLLHILLFVTYSYSITQASLL
jgi:hypothetical protein